MNDFFGDYIIRNEWMSNTEEERKQKINQIVRRLCIAELEKREHFDFNKDVARSKDTSNPENKEVSESCL